MAAWSNGVGRGYNATIVLAGYDELAARLKLAYSQAAPMLGRACYETATLIFNKSQAIVPQREGTLRSSGTVGEPIISAGSAMVEFGYGGAANAYAAVQHERTDFKHAPGLQAKYLSTPLEAAAAGFGANVIARLNALLDGRLT